MTKWIFISYDSKKPLISKGSERATIRPLDTSTSKISSVEIYIFGEVLPARDRNLLKAEIYGAKFRDNALIIFPQKVLGEITKIFDEVFPGSYIYKQSNKKEEGEIVRSYMPKYLRSVLNPPAIGKLSPKVFEFMEETMVTKDVLLKEIKTLSVEEQEQMVLALIDADEVGGKDVAYIRMARRMLKSIRQVSDKLVSGASLNEMLHVIVEGLIGMFGSKRVAVMICGFDESLPRYHQFIPSTYYYGGTDRVRLKNMESHGPPRAGRKEGSSVITMELQQSFYFNDRKRPPEDTPSQMLEVLSKMDEELKSAAFLPLMLGSERVGITQIQFSDSHHFSGPEKTEIGVYTQIAALTLYNVNLKRQIDDSKSMFLALQKNFELFQEGQAIGSQNVTLDNIAEQMTASRKYSDMYIASYNAKVETAKRIKIYQDGRFVDVSQEDEFQKSELGPFDRYVLDSSKSLFVPNRLTESARELGLRLGFGRLPKAYLGVPIVNRDGLRGIVVVQDYEDENKLDASDKAIVEGFAAILGRII
jgi:GAF domain-containing protein